MPTIKSAKKRMDLSARANEQNRAKRSRVRTAIKRVLQTTDAEQAEQHLRLACALIDRGATKRLYHPNRAARIKRRLARHVNSLSA